MRSPPPPRSPTRYTWLPPRSWSRTPCRKRKTRLALAPPSPSTPESPSPVRAAAAPGVARTSSCPRSKPYSSRPPHSLALRPPAAALLGLGAAHTGPSPLQQWQPLPPGQPACPPHHDPFIGGSSPHLPFRMPACICTYTAGVGGVAFEMPISLAGSEATSLSIGSWNSLGSLSHHHLRNS